MKRTILLISLGIFLHITAKAGKISVIDSLKCEIAKCSDDTNKVNLLFKLLDKNDITNSDKKTLENDLVYCNEAFTLSKKCNYKKGIMFSYSYYSYLKCFLGRNDEAIVDNYHFKKIAKEMKDTSKIVASFLQQLTILDDETKQRESLKICLDSILPIIESSQDKIKQYPLLYNDMSMTFIWSRNYKKAIEYFEKAIPYFIKLKDNARLAGIYSNISMVYQRMKDYVRAIEYLNEALKLTDKEKPLLLAYLYGNLASNYMNLDKLNEAGEYLQLSVKLQSNFPVTSESIITYLNLGRIYRLKKMSSKAIQFFNKGLEESLKLNSLKSIMYSYRGLCNVYSDIKDYQKSNEYLIKSMEYRDSIYYNDQNKQINDLEAKYQASEKKKQIQILNKENEIYIIKVAHQRTIILFTTIGFIMLCFLAFLFYGRYKANKKVADKLKELDELKSQFFANMSHELRTPVSLILGPASTLQKNISDKRSQKEVEVILNNSQKLLILINQLLDFSKIEKKAMALNVQYANLTQSIYTIMDSFSFHSQQLGVQLDFKPAAEDITGWFDVEKMDKILINLISNAFKFTPKGGRITVGLNYHPNKRDLVTLSVADTGIGIAADKQQHIFKRFYQIDGSVKRKYEGTGIGLALVKDLVELHHGKINVNSRLNEGSTFEVTLSLLKEAYNGSEIMEDPKASVKPSSILSKTLAEEASIVYEQKHTQAQILVIEDNMEMRQYIVRNLNMEYNIIEASNGQEGLVKARENMPALIIADIMMPVMDGYEFTRTIKNDSLTSHIPVIMLTALVSNENRIQGLENEADDYITKPFVMEELLLRIRNLLLSRKKLRDKFSKFISIEPSEIVTTSVDEQFLLKALQLVEENITDEEYGVDKFCADMEMSRRNLYRKIKELTDLSLSEFLKSIRLKRAAQLISQKAASITEISNMVGFSSVSYFTKCFKEEFKVNPSEYMEVAQIEQAPFSVGGLN